MTIKRSGSLIGAFLLILVAGCQPIPPVTAPLEATAPAAIEPAVAQPTSGQLTFPLPTDTPAPVVVPTVTPLSVEETPMNASPSPRLPYDPAMEPLVRAAVNDLAQRLGIPPEEIEVIEAQAVVWPDTSMGCPQPDMRYLQVPQDGAFIQLKVAGKLYNYHYGGRRGLFLCEQVGKSGAPPSFDELQLPGGGGEDL